MRFTIHWIKEKLKGVGEALTEGGQGRHRDLFLAFIVVSVGFLSFGLGRLSRIEEAKMPIEIVQTAPSIVTVSAQASEPQTSLAGQAGMVVASKNGTKYHFPWCSGAKNISEANKVWFASTEEAKKAGYTPASNCKGLE